MLALNESQTAYLPVGIKEIRFHEKLPTQCQALLEITQQSERAIHADVTLLHQGRVCCEVRGIRCDAVQLVADPLQKAIDSMTYRANWFEVGYSDSQAVMQKVALVGHNIPAELKDALMAYGTEKIDSFSGIEELVQSSNIADIDLIALFVGSSTIESAMEDAVSTVTGLQQLANLACKAAVVFVTEQAMAEEIRHSQNGWLSSWCIGLRRNASNELTEMSFRNIDVTNLKEDSYMLAAEMTSANAPDEVALFGRNRYAIQVAALETSDYADMTVKMREQFKDQGNNNFRLNVPSRPSIQNLVFSKAERVAPGDYEIEIRVDFVSINYKDLAKVVGMLTEEMMANVNSGMTLGLECSGEVVAVGEKVKNYQLGDKVIAGKTDCFSRYVLLNTNRDLLPVTPVLPLPRNHSMAEGAVMFAAYLTSLWGLKHMANLVAGETVLIHGAAGGVGVAAVILAKKLGACVIAAAGTDIKRDYLKNLGADHVLDSRTLNFGNEVMAITGGRGVDVVFNSVGGGVVPVSFEVLADLGRFVEIGKAEMYSGGALSLVPFDRGICYFTLDLDFLVTRNVQKYFALVDEVWQLVDSGFLKPLPVTVFGANEIVDAFTYLSTSKQIGKVVIDCSQLPLVSSVGSRNKPLSPEKTVLVTGGLGGVGLMYANWLVDQGVKKLALLGRKGANTDEAKSAVAEFQTRGTEVDVYSCDVGDQHALKMVIDTIQRNGVLGSVVHAAGVLDDKAFQEMNGESIKYVASPKMLGAYNLHVLTKDNPKIEMFLVISSVSAVTGNTFQVNYCLANTFMDGLIEYRVSQGLPGNSLQLGAVAEVGMAQSNSDVERYLKAIGINTFDLGMMHAAFKRIYQWNLSTLSLMDIDWPVWEYAETGASSSFRFKEIISQFGSGSKNTSIKSTLLLMSKEERIETIGCIVAEHLANLLQMNAEEVDLEVPMENFGIDSITAVELQLLINRSLQIDLSILALLSSKSLINTATEISTLIEQDQATSEPLNPEIAQIVNAATDSDVIGMSSEGEPA
jgi:NADPH:quinone reductase-like Zn-dependent oxidoreductase/acyl carrier protein